MLLGDVGSKVNRFDITDKEIYLIWRVKSYQRPEPYRQSSEWEQLCCRNSSRYLPMLLL